MPQGVLSVGGAARRYLVMCYFRVFLGIGQLVWPTVSLTTTTESQLEPGLNYTLAIMTVIQAVLCYLTYEYGNRILTDPSNTRKSGCSIGLGIFMMFLEVIVLIMNTLYTILAYDAPGTNRALGVTVVTWNLLVLIAITVTLTLGITAGPILGANCVKDRQVQPSITLAEYQYGTQLGNMATVAPPVKIASAQELQLQNLRLQEQIMLQKHLYEQQLLNSSQLTAHVPTSTAPAATNPV